MVRPADQADTEWEDLLAQMGDDVEPDTYMKAGDVLTGSAEASEGWAARVNSLEFKGYVRVWDNRTGVESLQPRWLLWQTMNKRREDGSRVFTTVDPRIPQPHGADLKCPLHPDSPDHDRYVSMGFRECNKQHIPHIDGLNRHVRKSHLRLLELQNQEREERIREEDRELQRQTLAVMSRAVGGNQVRDLPQTPEAIPAVQHMANGDGICLCGWQSHAKRKQNRRVSLQQHISAQS